MFIKKEIIEMVHSRALELADNPQVQHELSYVGKTKGIVAAIKKLTTLAVDEIFSQTEETELKLTLAALHYAITRELKKKHSIVRK